MRGDRVRVPTLDATHPDGKWAALVADLDRCQHGRHEGDPCVGCDGGKSTGNPHMEPGQTIGYSADGTAIMVPEQSVKHHPVAWRTSIR